MRMSDDNDKLLERNYTNLENEAAFGGENRLVNSVRGKLTRDDVRGWLRKKDYFTVFKKAKKRFQRRPTLVSGLGITLQADLIDMRAFATKNDGNKFILTCVDVMSRFAWALPLANKSGRTVAEALDSILDGRNFSYLHTDKGKEFYNERVSLVLKKHGVRHYSIEDDRTKASTVERFNQTLGSTLHRFMTYRREKRFVDVLQTIVETYNKSPHGRDGLVPTKISSMNKEDAWLRRFETYRPPTRRLPNLKSGDHVRIALGRGTFARGYDEYWSREVFVIEFAKSREQPVVYVLKDLMGERIRGTYYEEELQLIDFDPNAQFEIESVLDTRRRRGRVEKLVKWLGYPEKFNQWIPAGNIV